VVKINSISKVISELVRVAVSVSFLSSHGDRFGGSLGLNFARS